MRPLKAYEKGTSSAISVWNEQVPSLWKSPYVRLTSISGHFERVTQNQVWLRKELMPYFQLKRMLMLFDWTISTAEFRNEQNVFVPLGQVYEYFRLLPFQLDNIPSIPEQDIISEKLLENKIPLRTVKSPWKLRQQLSAFPGLSVGIWQNDLVDWRNFLVQSYSNRMWRKHKQDIEDFRALRNLYQKVCTWMTGRHRNKTMFMAVECTPNGDRIDDFGVAFLYLKDHEYGFSHFVDSRYTFSRESNDWTANVQGYRAQVFKNYLPRVPSNQSLLQLKSSKPLEFFNRVCGARMVVIHEGSKVSVDALRQLGLPADSVDVVDIDKVWKYRHMFTESVDLQDILLYYGVNADLDHISPKRHPSGRAFFVLKALMRMIPPSQDDSELSRRLNWWNRDLFGPVDWESTVQTHLPDVTTDEDKYQWWVERKLRNQTEIDIEAREKLVRSLAV
ncbi:uncharacterized protein V1516DRAFT_686639 [Lipomyces oligophaga]|uniref:uncharacterized protein n=1 Tax=Lipomyces oligophaga TaxID=45792 RepID=UPI0034CE5A70